MEVFVTPKQVATALGVSESSLKRWCDQGLLQPQRTAGGHRRLLVSEVIGFIRRTHHSLVHPQILGLPAGTWNVEEKRELVGERLFDALIEGREDCVRKIAFCLYVNGETLTSFGDRLLAPAMHAIGEKWRSGQCEVFVERRACNIALRLLHELRSVVACPGPEAPVAIGGALSGDHYLLPTALVELTLREAGWKSQDLGVDLPGSAMASAVEKVRPRLAWISVSHVADPEAFLAGYREFYRAAEKHRVAVAVGGQALTPCLRKQMEYCSHCDTLEQLATFARNFKLGASRCDQN